MDQVVNNQKPFLVDDTPPTVVRMKKSELKQPDGTPRWLIYEVLPDGTEKLLGLQ